MGLGLAMATAHRALGSTTQDRPTGKIGRSAFGRRPARRLTELLHEQRRRRRASGGSERENCG